MDLDTPHSEIQAPEAAGSQDITDSDILLDEMWLDLLDGAEIYDGPGAFRTAELMQAGDILSESGIVRKAKELVRSGLWIEVKVPNPNRGNGPRLIRGWVKKEIYDEWQRRKSTGD